MKQKAGYLKKISKIDKSLANLTKMRREKPISVKSECKREDNNIYHRNPGYHQRLC
jgi:hypothetical protein